MRSLKFHIAYSLLAGKFVKFIGEIAWLIVLARDARSGISSLLSRAEQNFGPLATKFARLHSFRERNF